MKKVILLVLCGFLMSIISCRQQDQVEPMVSYFLDDTFVVIEKAKKLGKEDIGIVTIKPNEGGRWRNAMVIPFREIPAGTEVELIHIRYQHDGPTRTEFLLVQ